MKGCFKYKSVGYFLWTAGQRHDPSKKDYHFVWKVNYEDNKNYTEYPMTYINWHPGEPNRIENNDNCVNLFSNHDYTWNNQPCHFRFCFVCEMNKMMT